MNEKNFEPSNDEAPWRSKHDPGYRARQDKYTPHKKKTPVVKNAALTINPSASFYDFKWKKPEVPRVLEALRYVNPTEIQEKAIPLALAGQNVIGQSKTGTGKTLAYGAPIIDKISSDRHAIQSVILVPTRELCLQVAEVMRELGESFGLNVLEIYGGIEYNHQKEALVDGEISIVVATPGRLIDLFHQNYLKFDEVSILVLDEADRMLDMGFFDDIEYIFKQMPRQHLQLMLFSATIFQEIMESIDKITHGNHTIIRIGKNEDEFVVDEIDQEKYIILNRNDKYAALKKILKEEQPEHCLIFSNTISGVEFLERRLGEDYSQMKAANEIVAISGNVSQKRRERIINDFKAHKIHLLIATDVASRGLDIPNISHVILYDVPQYPENYIHRIGRTGRLSQEDGTVRRGKAITIVIQDEIGLMQRIEDLIKKEIPVRKGSIGAATRHAVINAEPGDSGDEEEDDWRPMNPFRM